MFATRIAQLAGRMRLSDLDVIGIARDAAGNPDVMSLSDLTPGQLRCMVSVMELMAEPCRVDAPVLAAA